MVRIVGEQARGHGKHKIVIGKDTRLSGYMLENAISSGILSMGVDVLFIGPYDLSTSLGLPGQFEHPKVREAITEIVERAGERGVAVGIWVPDAPSAHFWVDHGVRFVTVSNNELLLFGASAALRRSLER